MVLWMWPLTAVRLASDWVETMTIARTVIDARMPMIAAAWTNPFTANHSELTRMVTEKNERVGSVAENNLIRPGNRLPCE